MQVVSTLKKYVNAPSTRGFVDLLNDICEGRVIIDQAALDALDIASLRPHALTCKSIFDFDEALWKILPRINLDIDWIEVEKRRSSNSQAGSYSERSDPPTPTLTTNQLSNLSDIATQAAEAINARRNQSSTARKATSNQLTFFAEVNALFMATDSFEVMRRKATELERLLLSFPLSESHVWSNRTVRLPPRAWRWVAQAVGASYLAGVAHEHIADVSKHRKFIASGLALTQGALFFQAASVSGVRGDPSIFQAIFEQANHLEDDRNVFSQFSSVCKLFREGSDTGFSWVVVFLALMQTAPTSYTRSECWHFFINSYYEELSHWHDHELDEVGNEAFSYVTLICLFATLSADCATLPKLMRRNAGRLPHLEAESDVDSFCSEHKKCGLGDVPSVELSCYLLSQIRDYDKFDVESSLSSVANLLVNTVNLLHISSGHVPYLELIRFPYEISEDGFFLKRSVFYKSLSTLAINLAETEWDAEHFDEMPADRCFMDATRCIAESGYREYSAVFLAFALLRSRFFLDGGLKIWSVRELDVLIRQALNPKHVEQYIVPCLTVLRDFAQESFEETPQGLPFSLWRDSVISEFANPLTPILQLVPLQRREEVPIPAWFNGGSEDLSKALNAVRIALSNEAPTAEQWRQLSNRHNVHDAVGEILRQFEAQLKYFFHETYDAFYRDDELAQHYAIVSANAKLNWSGSQPSWGWIEIFLGCIAIARDVGNTGQYLKKFCLLANRAVPGLGDALISVNGRRELVQSLEKARLFDNEYTSHNQPIKRNHQALSNSRGVVHKKRLARADVQWIFDYVTVDFGLLFDILKPIIPRDDCKVSD
jgi:hypothetical protein